MDAPRRSHVVAAVIAVGLLVGCGTSSRPAGAAHSAAAAATDGGPPPSQLADPIVVREPLSAASRRALLAWMESWRACMADHGVALPGPQVHPRHVSIDVEAVAGYLDPGGAVPPAPGPFMRKSMACVAELGGTPATFLRTGGIVDLFKGTCALQAASKPGAT
jgi:hypothetical protein